VLVTAASTVFSVPLDIKIHEGLIFSNRDKRTLLDKLLELLSSLQLAEPCYLVADAYYSNSKMVKGTLKQGHHLITRAKSNCVALEKAPKRRGKPTRGRPAKYGAKIKLANLFRSARKVSTIPSPLYGEKNMNIRVRTVDLYWETSGEIVRFVLTEHPTRGRWILLCTDLTLDARDIVLLYGLRFKIEVGFKQAEHVIGAYDYVQRKMHAYHVFMFMGVVSQGLMQYLSACYTDLVTASFGSWLRTIRKGVSPSELIVRTAMQNTLAEFLSVCSNTNNWAIFVTERQDRSRAAFWGRAA